VRTQRTSNEARQVLLYRLAGTVRRLVGRKCEAMGGNAVLGYSMGFDSEGGTGIVARACGTACVVERDEAYYAAYAAHHTAAAARAHQHQHQHQYQNQNQNQNQNQHQHQHLRGDDPAATAAPPAGGGSPSPRADHIHTTSSGGNLAAAASGSAAAADPLLIGATAASRIAAPPPVDSAVVMNLADERTHGGGGADEEIDILTLTELPTGVHFRIGGIVSAKSVKLTTSRHVKSTRDEWWEELREELRSLARSLRCTHVMGYAERTSIDNGTCVCYVQGTAVQVLRSTAARSGGGGGGGGGGNSRGASRSRRRGNRSQPGTPRASVAGLFPHPPTSPQGHSGPIVPAALPPTLSIDITAGAGAGGSSGAAGAAMPSGSGTASASRRQSSSPPPSPPSPQQSPPAVYTSYAPPCLASHTPLPHAAGSHHGHHGIGGDEHAATPAMPTSPQGSTPNPATPAAPGHTLPCQLCHISGVPDILLSTIPPPPGLLAQIAAAESATPTLQPDTATAYIEARVVRNKGGRSGEANAAEISAAIPFLDYELHRQLVGKLRLRGLNAAFGVTLRVSVGSAIVVATASATGVLLPGLPVQRVVGLDDRTAQIVRDAASSGAADFPAMQQSPLDVSEVLARLATAAENNVVRSEGIVAEARRAAFKRRTRSRALGASRHMSAQPAAGSRAPTGSTATSHRDGGGTGSRLGRRVHSQSMRNITGGGGGGGGGGGSDSSGDVDGSESDPDDSWSGGGGAAAAWGGGMGMSFHTPALPATLGGGGNSGMLRMWSTKLRVFFFFFFFVLCNKNKSNI
jgi:hypothetical protein